MYYFAKLGKKTWNGDFWVSTKNPRTYVNESQLIRSLYENGESNEEIQIEETMAEGSGSSSRGISGLRSEKATGARGAVEVG